MPNTYILVPNDELCHYGVKGMKWGVRRYRNADGTLTAAGRKQARQEYKKDNAKAFELGKTASIYGHATAASLSRFGKISKKYTKQLEKDPDANERKTKRLREKKDIQEETTRKLGKQYETYRDMAKAHCESLVNKYGKEAVKSIRYKDVKVYGGKQRINFRTMNERATKLSDWAKAGAQSIVESAALSSLLNAPIVSINIPTNAAYRGGYKEAATRMEVTKEHRLRG
jgi:hypothetical protein